MSKQVNIHAAKTHFSKLVEEVEAGGEVIVARAGKPILKLVLIDPAPIKRELGFAKDLFDDFDQAEWDSLDDDFAKSFNSDKF